MGAGISELDLHGMTQFQAKIAIDSFIKRAGRDVYRIRIIHGYHGGTALREMIRHDYKGNKKIIRIECGLNQGETDLVLREF